MSKYQVECLDHKAAIAQTKTLKLARKIKARHAQKCLVFIGVPAIVNIVRPRLKSCRCQIMISPYPYDVRELRKLQQAGYYE